MKFQHTDHTERYYSNCRQISSNLIDYDWKSLFNLDVNMVQTDDYNNHGDLAYNFLKISSKLYTKIEKTPDQKLNDFLSDPNILSVGRILLGSNAEIGLHKDDDYWTEKFYRIHIPINETGAIFFYDGKKIKWEKNEVYIFDVMNVLHGGENKTEEIAEIIYVDITQNEIIIKEDENLSRLKSRSHQVCLEVMPSDLIFEVYKKFYSPEGEDSQHHYIDKVVKDFSWKSWKNNKEDK